VSGSRLCIEVTADDGLKVEAVAYKDKSEESSAQGVSGSPFYLPVPEPTLWSPDNPFLYGLKLRLKDKKGRLLEEVSSYFGMREVGLKKIDGTLRPTLNGEFIFHIGLLDQGYWPDGLMTAPSDEALAFDVQESEDVHMAIES